MTPPFSVDRRLVEPQPPSQRREQNAGLQGRLHHEADSRKTSSGTLPKLWQRVDP
jgi:hypothetical protein